MDSFCQSEFGITEDQINASIADTNSWYGGNRPAGRYLSHLPVHFSLGLLVEFSAR